MTAIRVTAREHDMLGTPVRRVLPARQCRAVGPFVFLDHFGPTWKTMQVAPHPHIGLSTLTWLFSGTIRHTDSLGNDQWIRPGEVNWMTAGQGIVHAERSDLEPTEPIHGLQCWVAQTVEQEQGEPGFQHLDAAQLPRFSREGIDWTLVIGHWLEARSPLAIDWPTFFVQGEARTAGTWVCPYPATWALGIYVMSGRITLQQPDGTTGVIEAGELIAVPPPTTDARFEVSAEAGARFVCLGGEPLPEARHFDWNFVASNKALLAQARDDWMNGHRFGTVPGDAERIPHPAEDSGS